MSLSKYKPTLLSLVANQYSHKQLLELGFEISQLQFSRANTTNNNNPEILKAHSQSFTTPANKTPINKHLAILQTLLNNSRISPECREYPA